MTQCTADFERGTNGSQILAADPGSATAWNLIGGGAPTMITYSTTHPAHGSLGAHVAGSASTRWLEWAAAHGNTTNDFGRVYLWRDAVDAVQKHFWLSCLDSSSQLIGRFIINTTGKIEIQSSGGGIAATGAVTVATGQQTRLEYKIINDGSAGVLEVKLFNSAESSTPDETITATSLNTRTDTRTLRFGSEQSNSAGYVYYMDDIVAGATSYPGPWIAPPAQNLAPVIYGRGAC